MKYMYMTEKEQELPYYQFILSIPQVPVGDELEPECQGDLYAAV